MNSWTVSNRNGIFSLFVNGEKTGIISSIIPSNDMGHVKVKTDEMCRKLALTAYNKVDDVDPFRNCLSSRSKFVEKWNKVCEVQEQSSNRLNGHLHLDNTEKSPDVLTDVKRKLAYSYALVHVKNLVEPPVERKFRDVDMKRVKLIQDSLQKRPDLKCHLLLGNTGQARADFTEETLRTPGAIKIEVIGGNHTRIALQNLCAEECSSATEFLFWPVKIYSCLSNLEAHKLGFDHNLNNENSKPTSAIDLLKFFRKELLGQMESKQIDTVVSKNCIKQWKTNLSLVLGITKAELHNRYKTLFSLGQVKEGIWREILVLDSHWMNGTVPGQVKSEIKIGHLKNLASLPEDAQLSLLKELNEGRIPWETFRKHCIEELARKDKTETETDDGNPAQADVPEVLNANTQAAGFKTTRAKCACNKDTDKKLECALINVQTLSREIDSLKRKLEETELEKEIMNTELKCMKQEKSTLEESVELLKLEKATLEEDLQHYMFSQSTDFSDVSTLKTSAVQSEEQQLMGTTTEETEDQFAVVEYNNLVFYIGKLQLDNMFQFCKKPFAKYRNGGVELCDTALSKQLNTKDKQTIDMKYIVIKFTRQVKHNKVEVCDVLTESIRTAIVHYLKKH